MPFVQRDESGFIVAVSRQSVVGMTEEVAEDDEGLQSFLAPMQSVDSSLSATDQSFIRVLEDVVQLLVDKGVILFTDLPQSAQNKMLLRQQLRSEMPANLDLISDDYLS